MSKKALLMIFDGWGLGDQKKDDVIFNTPTPYWDYLMNNNDIPVWEKYTLTIEEASKYFRIGENKLRRLRCV